MISKWLKDVESEQIEKRLKRLPGFLAFFGISEERFAIVHCLGSAQAFLQALPKTLPTSGFIVPAIEAF